MAGTTPLFDDGRAERYDRIISRIVVGYEAMHRLARAAVMMEPNVRRVLVVGIGTAEEAITIAQDLPYADLVGVDPSADMLAIAREKIAQAGLAERIALICGGIDQAPDGPFDVATQLLVSHFVPFGVSREAHFKGIAARLRSGGLLVESALVAGPYEPLWRSVLGLGFDPEKVEDIVQGFHEDVFADNPAELVAIISSAGFSEPNQVFQSLFARMWTFRRNSVA